MSYALWPSDTSFGKYVPDEAYTLVLFIIAAILFICHESWSAKRS